METQATTWEQVYHARLAIDGWVSELGDACPSSLHQALADLEDIEARMKDGEE